MAVNLPPKPRSGVDPDKARREALAKESEQRIADCRTHKAHVDQDLREAYFFSAPHRSRETSSQSAATNAPQNDAGLVNTSLGMEVSSDFVTEMLNTFLPSTEEWANQKPGVDIDDDQAAELDELIPKNTTAIFDTIKASNFYPAAALTFDPDLALGTVAMWIDDLRPAEPIVCQPVPIRELELNIGPYGGIDDRFVVQHVKARVLPAKFRGVTFPADIAKIIKDKPNQRVKITWGYWRKWDDDRDVVWQRVVMVNKHVIQDGELRGEGSCPLIVGRFGADPMVPFGVGPMIRTLPEFRRLDETEVLKMENIELQVRPPFMYPDDGVVNLTDGIQAGYGYPVRPGSEKAFGAIEMGGSVQVAQMSTEESERRIRRLFFVDYPQQRGDTPPTRAQWLDETLRSQRRIGTPGLTFWREFPAEVFLRFKWLMEKRGTLQKVKVNGKEVALVPYNPAEAAQDQQDVAAALQILEAARNYFPQTSELFIDQEKTLLAIKSAMRDRIIVIRKGSDIQTAAQQLGPLLGGGAGAPAPEMDAGMGAPMGVMG